MTRKLVKTTLATLLVTAQLMTLVSCSAGPEPKGDTKEVSAQATQTQEFKEDETKWNNSNFKKAWYSFDEQQYKDLLETLTVVSSTGTKDKPDYRIVYRNEIGTEGYVFGHYFVPKESLGMSTTMMMEKTGRKLYTVKTQKEKEELLKSQFNDGSYINGKFEADLSREIDGELYIDMTKISNISGVGYTEKGDTYEGRFHHIPCCGIEYAEKYTIDKSEIVTDADLNMYRSPLRRGDNMHMYVTPNFARNVLGIEVQITDGKLVTVWFDEVYKPTEDSIMVLEDLSTPDLEIAQNLDNPKTDELAPIKTPSTGKNISKDPNRVITSVDILHMSKEEMFSLIDAGTISMADLNVEEITADIKQRQDEAYIESSKKPYVPYTKWSEAEIEEYIKNVMYVKKITREEAYKILQLAYPVPTTFVRQTNPDGTDVLDTTPKGIKGDLFN